MRNAGLDLVSSVFGKTLTNNMEFEMKREKRYKCHVTTCHLLRVPRKGGCNQLVSSITNVYKIYMLVLFGTILCNRKVLASIQNIHRLLL